MKKAPNVETKHYQGDWCYMISSPEKVQWFNREGKLHHDYLPAVSHYPTATQEYWKNGVQYTDRTFSEEMKTIESNLSTVELSDEVVEKMIRKHNESLSMNLKNQVLGPEEHVNFGGRGYTFPYQPSNVANNKLFDDAAVRWMTGISVGILFLLVILGWFLHS